MTPKRSIFEEVGEGAQITPEPQGGMIDAPRRGRGPVRRWLAVSFLLVAVMILVGVLTRLGVSLSLSI